MASRPPISDVDRRDFIGGLWLTDKAAQTNAPAEIASVLVHVRPEQMDRAARAIAMLKGAEIYTSSPQGKLVVVIEAATVGEIGATLNIISSMPHVLTAALVFHGTDEG